MRLCSYNLSSPLSESAPAALHGEKQIRLAIPMTLQFLLGFVMDDISVQSVSFMRAKNYTVGVITRRWLITTLLVVLNIIGMRQTTKQNSWSWEVMFLRQEIWAVHF